MGKRCGLNSSGEHVPTEEAMMLGEGDDVHSVPKTIEGGVSVGSYVYSLRDLTDVTGTVSVSKAMDLLQKCDKDKQHDSDDELGASYDPTNTQEFNAEGGACEVKTIARTLSGIVPDQTDNQCQFTCEANGVNSEAFTAECSGSGNAQCFLTKTEIYQREVSSQFLGWKARCIGKSSGDTRAKETSKAAEARKWE